ncbi:sensor histidine kinase [Halomonas sp. 328]|uniref:sensor histidine kinase n=1 Tax=Halomonas sp. 328 TaxID=2776704 RepID=UPI0018A76AF2|nr:HAMP domain-containing sensor histidine kinase [Halomonas sp. 328]MBF8222302.1 HAMP domain-containing histidine kinase [Halomonas sp. 328]
MTTQVSRRWRPRSLLQLVLLAFLVVMLPLGVLMFQAGQALAELTRLADVGARQAVEETRRARALTSLSLEMERSARQYAVVEDPGLMAIFSERHAEFESLLRDQRRLLPDDPDIRALFPLLEELASLPDAAGAEVRERLDAFAALANHAEAVRRATNRKIDERIEAIRERADNVQARLWLQTLALVSASLALMLLFTWLIMRPIRQLERRILGIGGDSRTAPVAHSIQGPAELVQLGERLDWLSARLGEVEAQKQQFLRHMSHELKTPLASVREGTALLCDGVAGGLDPRQREILELIDASGEELQRLIEQLLDYNLLQHHREVDTLRFDMTALIEELLAKHRLALTHKGMRVSAPVVSLEWCADRTATGRILDNLLSNAIAYGEDGGVLEIRQRREGATLVLEVANSGAAIDESDRARLFEPFYQGRARRQGALKGSGIGLSVAADCARMQQGTLELVTDDLLPVCFRLTLPWQPGPPPSLEQKKTPAPPGPAAQEHARSR